ncbi:MAG: M1 family metallopeptidase [Bacteroidia bacterium]|nr:M1 family metallopeptidase [Bacteroidia bacterium]
MKSLLSSWVQTALMVFLSVGWVYGQSTDIFIPAELQRAYEAGTRSRDGNPGPNYWINRASYRIKANFDPTSGKLTGSEKITYHNQSPSILNQLVIRLYPDLLKKGGIRNMQFSPDMINDGVILHRLTINEQEVNLSKEEENTYSWRSNHLSRNGTNLFVPLVKALNSGEAITLEIDWEVTFPREFDIRMGAFGDRTWFVAYWFPQISVYDDIDGWDRLNYTPSQEMYNDFHDFEVEITVPGQTLVWATGELQNAESVLMPPFVEKLKTASISNEVVHIVTEADISSGKITPDSPQLTWKFKAEHVPDFAFAVSDSLIWDATSLEAEKNRRVNIHAVYDPQSSYYEECAAIAQLSVRDMQENVPGIAFPYPQVTVFQADKGGGGMEFPMLCNDGRVHSRADLIDLTYHEIAHTWFPFYTGINERKYSWMDEGWATNLPNDLVFKEESENGDPMSYNVLGYLRTAGTENDLPLIIPTNWLSGWNYLVNTYYKPSCVYHILRDMLGEEVYKKCLKTYIERWEGKHPVPWDFFNTFNEVSGKNLNWFWQAWFFDHGVPDLGLKKVEMKGKQVRITVEKIGKMPIPVHLTILFEDGTSQEFHATAEVWANGEQETVLQIKPEKNIQEITLGHEAFPDINEENQNWVTPRP